MPRLHLKQTLSTGFFFFFLLTYASVFAQITDEATYPTSHLQRLKLSLQGEVLYYADDAAQQIYLFTGDHSPWKTIDYPKEINNKITLALMNLPVSQTTFKADALLELVWLFHDTMNQKERIKILNERGDSIFFFPINQTNITVNELIDRPTKLFFEKQEADYTYSTTVYGLPNMVLEHTYRNASNFHRQIFGYAGEVYYFKNTPDKRLEIYNTNHSLRKSIPLAVPTNGGWTTDTDDYFFADDKMFNTDTLVEVVFSYVMNSTDQVRIANENKTVLFHSNFFSSFQIDRKAGLPDKLFWSYAPSIDAYPQCRVISLPFPFIYPSTTPREKTYDTQIERIVLSYYGAKYKYQLYTYAISLYDTSHILWKNLSLKSSSNYSPSSLSPFISDNIVNPDSLIEVIWIENTYGTDVRPTAYKLRIADERDHNIAFIPDAYHFQMSQLDGLTNKLITKMTNGTTKVWRFTTRTAIQDPSVSKGLDVQISPNPFVTSFTIHQNNSEYPLSIRLFNSLGQLVFAEKNVQNNALVTPPQSLSKGIYLLDIYNEGKHITQRLVKL
jgi:hypothetical protein